jgi:hypothetical protein
MIFLSSCATILNKQTQKIKITAKENIKILSVENAKLIDSNFLHNDSIKKYQVYRRNNPLKINVLIDSAQKSIYIKPRISDVFWANIFFTNGLGLIVDAFSNNTYGYPKNNVLKLADTAYIPKKFKVYKKDYFEIPQNNKGDIKWIFAYSFANFFHIKTANYNFASASLFGAESGLEYFYNRKRFLSLNAGLAANSSISDFEQSAIFYANVNNNHIVKDLEFGYGLNISNLINSKYSRFNGLDVYERNKNLGLGINVSTNYKVKNYTYIGFLYQPNLMSLVNKPVFNYQHYINFKVLFKVPVRKK